MIVDINELSSLHPISADICIIGAGAAGITLALDLSGHGLSIVVIESGHRDADEMTQALYEGELADTELHSPPEKYRQRVFGGSTTIWGGRCMPFDPQDFDFRPQVPDSGWPISYSEVAQYYPLANKIVEAGKFEYDATIAFPDTHVGLIAGFASEIVRGDGLERFSCPTNFAERYGVRLERAPDVKVLLGANCTGIRLDADGSRVARVDVSSLSGRSFSVSAGTTILATGGLENARLLLASRDVHPSGIGNEYDVVGRYYMCHIAGLVGSLKVNGEPSRVRHGYEVSADGIYCRRRFTLAADVQQRLGLGNMAVRLHFPRIGDPSHKSGVLSGLFLVRRLISYEYGKRLNDVIKLPLRQRLLHVGNIVFNMPDVIRFLMHWLWKRVLPERKFPSVVLPNRTNLFSLDVHGEQFPIRESRVTLSEMVDSLGIPKIRVDWRYCAADIESIRRTLDVFGNEFERDSIGRFSYDGANLENELTRFGAYGGHHIGTTRMGDDVHTSVVDRNCKVHKVSNLYIAGASVFPTSSQANPTLTVVALAIRLSRYLQANTESAA